MPALSEIVDRQEQPVNPLAHVPARGEPAIPAAGPGPPAGPAPHTGMPPEEGAASRDAEVDQLVDMANQLIFGGDTPEGDINGPVIQALRTGTSEGGQNPPEVIGNMGAMLVARAAASMPQPPEGAAAFYALLEVVGQLAEVAEAEGLFDFREEEVEQAVAFGAKNLYAMVPELFPQEEMAQDAQALQAAYDDGTMDQEFNAMIERVRAA